MCHATGKICIADNIGRRLDVDLEMFVCQRCGQGWVQDTSSCARLQESLKRFEIAIKNVNVAQVKMTKAFQKLSDSLAKI